MKYLFYAGTIGLLLFEIANVFFIMPMPGSQEINSIDLAYFLYSWRWTFRVVFLLFIIIGFKTSFNKNKWTTGLLTLLLFAAAYMFNFVMAADKMFYQPSSANMKPIGENKIKGEKLVLGITDGNDARAYPIQFIGYHHQVLDSLNGKPVMITYCTVCRTGRVYKPMVNGKYEKFRLVGMDHFNAMFEDETTGSWWRQVTGDAIKGKMKGSELPEVMAYQTSLDQWIKMYPHSLIMQGDTTFKEEYEHMIKYETGKGKSKLTKTDSLSWKEKSWIVGIENGKKSKAYDWNRFMKERIINDVIGEKPIVLILAKDDKSFFAFERPNNEGKFILKNDSIFSNNIGYDLHGKSDSLQLKKINAYQEFWHSWRMFHSETERY